MEFLVRQLNRMPPDEQSQRLREKLRPEERKVAQKLREAGILKRLWRVPGTQHAIGLYEDAPEPVGVLRIVRTVSFVLVEADGIGDLVRHGVDTHIDAERPQFLHEAPVKRRHHVAQFRFAHPAAES